MADPTLNDPLLREIEDDLRREQMEKLWRRYGNHLIAAVLAIVVAVAGYQGWQTWQQHRREQAAADLNRAMALSASDPVAAASVLEGLAANGAGGYPTLAGLQRAGLLARQGDTAAALDGYRWLVRNAASPLYRDLATLSGVALTLAGDTDPAQRETLRASLLPLAGDSNPWRFSARELLALIALDDGQKPAARELFTKLIADPQTPPGVRQRAEQILGRIGDVPASGS